jgi:phosphoglycerate-specific signal transduction histidine kinase
MSGLMGRLGVGGRLLLAFLGISGFAVVVAAASVFAFLEIGDVLDRITQERVPSALAAQEVSRQAERVVSAAPTLLTVTNDEQRAARSREIDAEVERLDELIRLLGSAESSPADQRMIWEINRQLRQNLFAVDSQVSSRLVHAADKKAAVEVAQGTYDEIQQLLEPWVLVTDARIAKWRDVVERTDTSSEERATADDDLKESLSWLRSLQDLQLLLTSLSEQLQRLATSNDEKRLTMSRFRLALLVRKANDLVAGFDPKLRPQISVLLKRFEGFVVGPQSILSLRQAELANIAEAEKTLQQNAELSGQLTEAVNALVASAQSDITTANEEASTAQRLSMSVTITVVVLSLLCSILIVWLYVGRNLVARLTALSNSMMAIAGGNLKAPLPAPRGSDEISRMAEALTVFRDTAVEVTRIA